ncbi:MAG TPA: protein phosphatase 2C domain-containing protein [Kiritimatiellia bacterium]|nr:protein phosphatase 2C domain-containing protein [Kiritimatiellia bacterium]HMO98622.1 protein phosphatase 2C domain-containing protein [Kiritimatiellia bacterium]HMP96350.1 protein phosphatase 2C domain-containing protein [Kiritimatiellia bacterium]
MRSSTTAFSHLATAELTDQGRIRTRNEDAIIRLPSAGVFCVADGIGGGDVGHEASEATVLSLLDTFARAEASGNHHSLASRKALVREAMNRACHSIHQNGIANGYRQSGTTAVTMIFDLEDPGRAAILHAGDSRAYVFREGRLRRLTRDHTVAEEAGWPSDEAWAYGMRTIITRAVGVRPFVDLDETPVDVRSGDLFMLCTDGLTAMLYDRRIAELLEHHGHHDLERTVSELVKEANQAGGRDNITILLIRVDEVNERHPGRSPSWLSRWWRTVLRRLGAGSPRSTGRAFR